MRRAFHFLLPFCYLTCMSLASAAVWNRPLQVHAHDLDLLLTTIEGLREHEKDWGLQIQSQSLPPFAQTQQVTLRLEGDPQSLRLALQFLLEKLNDHLKPEMQSQIIAAIIVYEKLEVENSCYGDLVNVPRETDSQ